MAIKITENGAVRYENGPNVDRLLFPNVPGGYASPEQITQAVDAWLEDHPEATTTVTDGSINRVKLDSELNSYIEDITNLQTGKQDVLTFDQTPTAESTNPVTSVGIKNAIEAAVDVTAPGIYETASGSIASFADGADDLPLKSCVVNIEPIQEGTGDPSPENVRPISGRTGLSVVRSGKNLLLKARQSSTMNGITWTLNDDGSITASGTSTGRSYIMIIVSARDAYALPNGTYTYSLTPTGSDYTNIYSLIGSYKGGKYYKNVCVVGSSNNFAAVFKWNDSDLAAVLNIAVEVGQENKTVNCTIYPQIELGSLASSYEEYQGETYGIEFPTEAGTVYGAKLDVTKGELVVDHVLYAINDKSIITRKPGKTDYYFNVVIGDILSGSEINTGIISNILKSTPFSGASGIWDGNDGCCLRAGGFTFFTDATKNMDENAAKQWLINNEAEIYYPIATPITYQLTPQEIHTLLGENNIWSDAGDISVKYPADTKMYIDQKITEAIAAAMT